MQISDTRGSVSAEQAGALRHHAEWDMHYFGVYSLVLGALATGMVSLLGCCFLPWGSDHTEQLFLAVVPIGFQSGFDGVVQTPPTFHRAPG
jgi:hypothetical protein